MDDAAPHDDRERGDAGVGQVVNPPERDTYEGGGCTYHQIPGSVTVTAVEIPAPSDQYNCPNNPALVMVQFIPDNPEQPQTDEPHETSLTVYAGMNVPESCLAENGLGVGAMFRAVQSKIETGTCSPSLVDVELVNFESCRQQCYLTGDAGV